MKMSLYVTEDMTQFNLEAETDREKEFLRGLALHEGPAMLARRHNRALYGGFCAAVLPLRLCGGRYNRIPSESPARSAQNA